MEAKQIVLKVLLRQRHLQTHRAFCREYDRVAEGIDSSLKGGWPSKAQYYRWLSGDLLGLPYSDHCRILEKMFPGWTAEQLFQVNDDHLERVEPAPVGSLDEQSRISRATPDGRRVADVVAVFSTRSEFLDEMPPRQLFQDAHHVQITGISLNMLCQHYPDTALQALVASGTIVDCLFLDPNGEYVKIREQEEGQPATLLATLTKVNIDTMLRLKSKLEADVRDRLSLRVYDEIVRYNITIVDGSRCIVQPYLPDARGVESPTLVIQKQPGMSGLFDTFTQVFAAMWDRAKRIPE